jgi:MFS family permease
MSDDSSELELKLKYLELARDEILYRIKSANDTLIIYSGAIGAIAAWFSKLYTDLPQPRQISPDLDFVLFRIGVLVSFLSLCASWIINHNERMVHALAKYQREELGLNAPSQPLLWESSKSLQKGDPQFVSIISIFVYAGLIVGPSIFALIEMWIRRKSSEWNNSCFVIALVLTSISLGFMLGVVSTWWRVKSSRQSKSKSRPKT